MAKFTQAQLKMILRRLHTVADGAMAELQDTLKGKLVLSRAPKGRWKRRITKLVHDQPQEAVDLMVKLLLDRSFEPKFLTAWTSRYHASWDAYHAAVEQMRGKVEQMLFRMEASLTFEDTWDTTEFPAFLEEELLDFILGEARHDTQA